MIGIVRRLLLPALTLAAAHTQAQAQSWPDRPIKFISSQAAGNGTDVVGRLVADRLSARVGQPIVFENRPGGGNVIGTQAAARSAPDGYTFFFASAAALVTDPYTFKSLPYNPMKDFTVISRIAEVTFTVLAHPDVPAKNLPELFAYAKANPDKLTIATDGPRRFSGMIAAWLNKLGGTNISYVPYTQMTQGLQDVIAGRVQLLILAFPAAKGLVASGKLRALAVTSPNRIAGAAGCAGGGRDLPGIRFCRLVGAGDADRRAGRYRRAGEPRDGRHHEGPGGDRPVGNRGLQDPWRRHVERGERLRAGPARGLGNAGARRSDCSRSDQPAPSATASW